MGRGAKGEAGDAGPIVVIGELKQRFTLELPLQGVDRMAAGDEIWLAVRNSSKSRKRADGRLNDARVRKLCRLLGFGLLAVSARGRVDILAEPGPTARAATRAAGCRACCASTAAARATPPSAAARASRPRPPTWPTPCSTVRTP